LVAQSVKYIGYCLYGALAQFLIVLTLKVIVGRLRPCFIDVCVPQNSTLEYCQQFPHGYMEHINCTYYYRETRLSFPSGHSSWVFFAAIYTCIYMQYRARWRLCNSYFVVNIVQVVLMLAACVVSATRVTDNHHFVFDVLVGAFIGALSAILSIYIAGIHNNVTVNDDIRRVMGEYGANDVQYRKATTNRAVNVDRDAIDGGDTSDAMIVAVEQERDRGRRRYEHFSDNDETDDREQI